MQVHVRGRFAPSPTGPLHPGSLLAALGSWLFARHAGGEWWLRIEDVDRIREVAGAADDQLATLAAFGFAHDGPVERQSNRDALYAAALDRLIAAGHAFECHCSRNVLEAQGGIHRACVPGLQRPDPAIRLRVPDGCSIDFIDAIHGPKSQRVDRDVGDFVLKRSDGCWAYQLAVVVDDAAQGITAVVRGADLLDSSARQILLQRLLGYPTPDYAHLPLLVDRLGHKLSKSSAAHPIDRGDPLPALRDAWRQLGQQEFAATPHATSHEWLHDAVERFVPSRVPRGPLSLNLEQS
ncbi:tRNA glutamyl-Q(34) synthetase GluQRS [Solilutibacter silvestris]|uniref:Glutamyl-Q tRNA(Asp) synthetase n=1 Tax=Solilutibacter silvestris TaxID=1645665 RepID=A0A2K1Q423_9GAMM|nr:tRNA glutamyl-Q(34) synthetase GluQRS [Lysobacter silvestris]PNS09796.1 glutamyl-queuosine tRNA(Asp) synthetase [Lysobacter silvestris]